MMNKMAAPLDYFRFCLCIQLIILWFNTIDASVWNDRPYRLYDLFGKFTIQYKRSYVGNVTEFEHRFKIFKDNIEQAEILNKDYFNTSQLVHGVNKFSDLSPDEFKGLYLSSYLPKSTLRKDAGHFIKPYFLTGTNLGIPSKLDWRSKGVLTSVKNQQSCGACWAFSTVEMMETMHAIQYNTSVEELSVQQVIDCDTTSKGCEGGDICGATKWASSNGIVQEKYYPLKDETGKCKQLSASLPRIKVKDYPCKGFVGNENGLLKELVQGPVAVAVDATTWHSYVKGIIRFHCSPSNINHAVSVVGYDLTGEVPYYIVRNSWGSDFGDKGFMYIKIGDNLCGIAREVASVTVTDFS